jgi:hypothetical protein
MADSSDGTPHRSRGLSPAIIAGIATVLAAVITGVFVLIAQNKANNDSPVTTVQGPLRSGEPMPPPDSSNDNGVVFLADMDMAPSKSVPFLTPGYSDSIGGRAVIKTIGLYSGEEADYPISSAVKRFRASIGMSDGKSNFPTGGSDPPPGVFSVYGDDTLLWQQTIHRGFLLSISVPLKGYKIIRLGFSEQADTGAAVIGNFGLARFTQ